MEILRIAEHKHADLIVIATHGMTGWHKLAFGSVAEKVWCGSPSVRCWSCGRIRRRRKPVAVWHPQAQFPSAAAAP